MWSAGGGGGGGGSLNVSAGTTSNDLTNLVFADGNGVSWGLNASTVTATVQTNYLTSQSNQAITASNGGFNFQTLSFSNANGLSFGTSAGSAVFGSYTVPTVTNSSWTVSANGTSATVGSLVFSNANNFTFGLSSGIGSTLTITGSYTVPTVTNSSWTVSDAATSGTVARLAFTNLNGVTLSLSSGAGGSHTIVGSHNALTSQSNQAASASNGSFTFQTVAFSNANNVTFGTSAGSIITASVAAQTIETLSFYYPHSNIGSGIISTIDPGNASVRVWPIEIDANHTFSKFILSASLSLSTSSNSSHGGTLSIGMGFYSRNASTLSLATSGLGTYAWTNTSNNSTGSLSGLREVSGTFANMSLTPGNWWLAIWSRTSTANANWFTANNIIYGTGQSNTVHSGDFAAAAAGASFQPGVPGNGVFSATSSVLPASMAFSAITGTTAWWYRPHVAFRNFNG